MTKRELIERCQTHVLENRYTNEGKDENIKIAICFCTGLVLTGIISVAVATLDRYVFPVKDKDDINNDN